MIKLIASDVDGTLIKDSTPDMYPEMVEAIKKLKEHGVLFCATSGRQYQSLRNVFRDVADDIAYIAENGAHIHYGDKDISVIPMKREYVESIIKMIRPYYGECEIVVDTANGGFIESTNQEFIDLLTFGYRNIYQKVEDVLKEDIEIIKIAVYRKGSIREISERVFMPQWSSRVKTCISGEEWLDFMDLSVDKGNGLKFLEKHLGIAKEEVMAFGDNNNDIGMMLAAGTSYAVENAVNEVKKAAGHICPGWKEKGVYQILKKNFPEVLT